MSSNAYTEPTLETVLEQINIMRTDLNLLRQEVTKNFADFDVRVDRIESVVNTTRAEMLTLRADFREFKQKVEGVMKGVA